MWSIFYQKGFAIDPFRGLGNLLNPPFATHIRISFPLVICFILQSKSCAGFPRRKWRRLSILGCKNDKWEEKVLYVRFQTPKERDNENSTSDEPRILDTRSCIAFKRKGKEGHHRKTTNFETVMELMSSFVQAVLVKSKLE